MALGFNFQAGGPSPSGGGFGGFQFPDFRPDSGLGQAIGLGRDLFDQFFGDDEPAGPGPTGPSMRERLASNVREMGGSSAGTVCSSESFKRTACGNWVPQMHTEIAPDGGSNVFWPVSNSALKRAIKTAVRDSATKKKKNNCPR